MCFDLWLLPPDLGSCKHMLLYQSMHEISHSLVYVLSSTCLYQRMYEFSQSLVCCVSSSASLIHIRARTDFPIRLFVFPQVRVYIIISEHIRISHSLVFLQVLGGNCVQSHVLFFFFRQRKSRIDENVFISFKINLVITIAITTIIISSSLATAAA